ncbi:unnamed protein product [Coffea canephora]|uniref:Reverse transcriptase domain-containing protein n=1 Tax=Coffea canephora TaxID=49390 RepID=A0A068V0R1_COFCA|nr:unnamed protein product [Coffea canephora]
MLEFGSMFGLSPNLQKCQIFIAGLDAQEADSSRDIMQMPRRMLPVKYLGLPLISSRLSYKDCHPIFIKMEQKIKSWANKKLSYGGRLQLIQSVLTGIYLHWCSVFIVSRECVSKFTRKINSILASFLWASEVKRFYGARVSGKEICNPKKDGGLGLYNIECGTSA